MKYENLDFTIKNIGKPSLSSPIALSSEDDDYIANYMSDDD